MRSYTHNHTYARSGFGCCVLSVYVCTQGILYFILFPVIYFPSPLSFFQFLVFILSYFIWIYSVFCIPPSCIVLLDRTSGHLLLLMFFVLLFDWRTKGWFFLASGESLRGPPPLGNQWSQNGNTKSCVHCMVWINIFFFIDRCKRNIWDSRPFNRQSMTLFVYIYIYM